MKYIIIFLALVFAPELNAQDLKVTVRDVNEPLAFANIYLNGTYLKSADSTGCAFIPQHTLHLGDTISSSYLGFIPTFALYDENMQASRSCTLIHSKEQSYALEEVIVTGGGGGWKAFRKYVKLHIGVGNNYIAKGDFDAQIRLPDNSVRNVTGSFSLSKAMTYSTKFTSYSEVLNYFENLPVRLITQGDTTGISRMLMKNINFSYFFAIGTMKSIYLNRQNAYKNNHKNTLTYLGIKDGKRHFVLTLRPDLVGTEQALIIVDAQSKEIEYYYATSTAERRLGSWANSMAMHCEQSKSGRGLIPELTVPSKIEVDLKLDNEGFKTDLVLSNITVEFSK